MQLRERSGDEDAIQCLKLAAKERKDAAGWVQLADGYEAIRDLENTIRALKKALEMDGENLTALLKIANVFSQLKDEANAMLYLETAYNLRPDSIHTANNYALVLMRQGQSKKARQIFETALAEAAPEATLRCTRSLIPPTSGLESWPRNAPEQSRSAGKPS